MATATEASGSISTRRVFVTPNRDQKSACVSASHRPRILISHQGCVPIYRKALFDRLASLSDFEYVIACGEAPRGTDYILAQQPYDFPTLAVSNNEIFVGRKSIIWQTLVQRFWREFDAAILGDEIKYASHLAVIIAAKIRRRPVVLWGFGYRSKFNVFGSRQENRFKLWFLNLLSSAWLRLADGYLAYTESGAAALSKAGFPRDRIAVMRNTVDIEQQWCLRDKIARESEADSRRALGLPSHGPVLVYFGRFLPQKRIDLLIDYVHHCKDAGRLVSAVIFGSGTEHKNLIKHAEGLDTVFFRAPDPIALTRALRISAAVVIPGFIGLAITHGFAHGVPMITREGKHSPEVEYLRPGENGLILSKDDQVFFRMLDDFLADSALQKRLRVGAMSTAKQLSMDASVSALNGLLKKLMNDPAQIREV